MVRQTEHRENMAHIDRKHLLHAQPIHVVAKKLRSLGQAQFPGPGLERDLPKADRTENELFSSSSSTRFASDEILDSTPPIDHKKHARVEQNRHAPINSAISFAVRGASHPS